MSNTSTSDKVLKAGAGYVIGNYLLKGITFLSAPIFSRLMSTSEFGDFNTYISYVSIIYILVGLALHSSFNNAKYKFKSSFKEYMSSIILLILYSSLCWLFFANVFFPFYADFFKISRLIVNVLIIHSLGDALIQCFNTYASLNYSYKDFMKITYVNALSNMALSILLILTIMQDSRSDARILGTAIPVLFISIYIISYFFKMSAPKYNAYYWKYAIIYSLPIIPHGISQIILSSFDRIMINQMIGASEAGIYSFAYTIYSIFKVASSSLENVWKPWIYEKMNEKNYKAIRKHGTNYALIVALITIIIVLTSPEIIKVLGPKEYWGSAICVIPVVIGGYFSFLYTLPVLVEYYYEKTKFIAIGTVSAAIINIILNYIFIPIYGYVAAAYTTLITYFIYFVFHYILSIKIHGKELFSSKALFSISFSTILLGIVALYTTNYLLMRWILATCLGIYTLYFGNKNYNIIIRIQSKLKK